MGTTLTHYYDHLGRAISSDSLVSDDGPSNAFISSPPVYSLVKKIGGLWGYYNISGQFVAFKDIAGKSDRQCPCATVRKYNANDHDLLKADVFAKESLHCYCEYCMGNKKISYTRLRIGVEPGSLLISEVASSVEMKYKVPAKACPFCGRNFKDEVYKRLKNRTQQHF